VAFLLVVALLGVVLVDLVVVVVFPKVCLGPVSSCFCWFGPPQYVLVPSFWHAHILRQIRN